MNSISYIYPSEYLSAQLVFFGYPRGPLTLVRSVVRSVLAYCCALVRFFPSKSRCVINLSARGPVLTSSTCPFFTFYDWIGLLFTTCLLVVYLLGGFLFVVFRCSQLVTVDSKVKRNLKTGNSELPRPSTHLRTPMIEFETEAIHVTVTFLRFFGLRGLCVG